MVDICMSALSRIAVNAIESTSNLEHIPKTTEFGTTPTVRACQCHSYDECPKGPHTKAALDLPHVKNSLAPSAST
jgi:hypothetical protein